MCYNIAISLKGVVMENILDARSNKIQSIIKLEIAKENLEGVHQALSLYDKPKIEKSLRLIESVLCELKEEMGEK